MLKKKENKKGKMRQKKKLIIPVVLIIILAISLVFVYMPLNNEKVELNEKNSEIYSALVGMGIKNALVDVNEERVIVSYELPDNIEKEISMYYVMGTVAGISPDSKEIRVHAFVNGKAAMGIKVQINDIENYMNNVISEEEFKSRLVVSGEIKKRN